MFCFSFSLCFDSHCNCNDQHNQHWDGQSNNENLHLLDLSAALNRVFREILARSLIQVTNNWIRTSSKTLLLYFNSYVLLMQSLFTGFLFFAAPRSVISLSSIPIGFFLIDDVPGINCAGVVKTDFFLYEIRPLWNYVFLVRFFKLLQILIIFFLVELLQLFFYVGVRVVTLAR